MNKRIVYFGLLLIMIFSFAACTLEQTPQERIEKLCDIELPQETEVEFHYTFSSFSSTDGLYTVFKLKEILSNF